MAKRSGVIRVESGGRLHSIIESLDGQRMSLLELLRVDPLSMQHVGDCLLENNLDPRVRADTLHFEVVHAPPR